MRNVTITGNESIPEPRADEIVWCILEMYGFREFCFVNAEEFYPTDRKERQSFRRKNRKVKRDRVANAIDVQI